MENIMKTDIRFCARCGEDHEQLEFLPFKIPIEIDDSVVSPIGRCVLK